MENLADIWHSLDAERIADGTRLDSRAEPDAVSLRCAATGRMMQSPPTAGVEWTGQSH